MQHTPNRGHNLDFFTKIHIHLLFTFSESYQRSYLTQMILILFLRMFIQPIRHIENIEFFEFVHSMECYESINKGCICTVPLLRE